MKTVIVTGAGGQDGSYIVEKYLNMKNFRVVGIERWNPTGVSKNLDNVINANRLLVTWDVATSTWVNASTGVPWATAGAQSDGVDRVATPTGSVSLLDTILGATSIDVTSDVQGFVNGSLTNNGWLLERNVAGAFVTGFTYFASSEGTDGTRPFLSVTYVLPVLSATAAPVLANDSGSGLASVATQVAGAALLSNELASGLANVSSSVVGSTLLGNDLAAGTASLATQALGSALLGNDLAAGTATVVGTGASVSGQALLADDTAQGSATVTGVGLPTTIIGGVGGKSKRKDKTRETFKSRQLKDEQIFNYVLKVIENVVDENIEDLPKTVVSVKDIATEIASKSDTYTDNNGLLSKAYLEEVARLQTYLMLEDIKRSIRQDDEEVLLLL